MGTYVQFWRGTEDGLLGHFLGGPLDAFRKWCIEAIADYPGDLEPAIVPLLEAVLAVGASALQAETAAQAALVDRLLDTYYGHFCDGKCPELLESADGSLLYVRRYDSILEALARLPDKNAELLLWSYLIGGRAVQRDQAVLPYQSEDGIFRLSYWSAEETALMGRLLIGPVAGWLRDVDAGALECTAAAIESAMAQRTGLIITVA